MRQQRSRRCFSRGSRGTYARGQGIRRALRITRSISHLFFYAAPPIQLGARQRHQPARKKPAFSPLSAGGWCACRPPARNFSTSPVPSGWEKPKKALGGAPQGGPPAAKTLHFWTFLDISPASGGITTFFSSIFSSSWGSVLNGRFLIGLCDLVGAPRGHLWQFFCFPGRVGHMGGPSTKWGGRGRPAGHMAMPPAVPRVRFPLAGPWGAFFSRGVASEISG